MIADQFVFIIHFGNENESFDNVGKFHQDFVMILGEYEFDDFYESAS